MISRVSGAAAWMCGIAMLASACDSEDGPSGVPTGVGNGDRDGEAQLPLDGGSAEGGAAGGGDAGEGPGVDGSVPLQLDCDLGNAQFGVPVDGPDGRWFATSVRGSEMYLTYLVPSCDEEAGTAKRFGLMHTVVPSSGSVPFGEAVTNVGAGECNFITRDPALVASGSGNQEHLYAYFVANNSGGYQLYAVDLAANGVRQTLSNVSERASRTVGAGKVDGTAIVAWAHATVLSKTTQVELFRNAEAYTGTTLLEDSDGYGVSAIAVGELAAEGAERPLGLLAWVSQSGSNVGVYTQTVDSQAKPVGAVRRLSSSAGGASSVDVVASKTGGVVVYTVAGDGNHQIRFQRVDFAGAPVGREVKLTSGDQNVGGASIAPFGTGFVVAYKVLSEAKPAVRLAFVDEQGNLAGTRDVAFTNQSESQARVHLSNDGRLFVTWTDVSPEQGPLLRTVRAECR